MPYFLDDEYTLNPGLLSLIFLKIFFFFYPDINHLSRKEYWKDTYHGLKKKKKPTQFGAQSD